MRSRSHSWVEISRSALLANVGTLRGLCGPTARLAPVVKANAYGHGLELCARIFASAGADMLCVNEVAEAEAIASLGVPVYLLGPSLPEDAPRLAAAGCEVVSSSEPHVRALSAAGVACGVEVPVHLKVETGTNRQGVPADDVMRMVDLIRVSPGVRLAGVCTHLADVEDETEHTFARVQLDRFDAVTLGLGVPRHSASSAAHLLFERARMDMVRPGIASYGLWPSAETEIAARMVHGEGAVELTPALSWKTRVTQVKWAAVGDYVGYGRTRRLSRRTRVAILPVGYYDGFDRQLSGRAQVSVRGQLAPLLGRVCMNMVMVDVTEAPAEVGDEVTLLGGELSADLMAQHIGTISYEVTTRIHERLERVETP